MLRSEYFNGAIVEWIGRIGGAGGFPDHGLLPKGESLRVQWAPKVMEEQKSGLNKG